jgi:hypothetical protein
LNKLDLVTHITLVAKFKFFGELNEPWNGVKLFLLPYQNWHIYLYGKFASSQDGDMAQDHRSGIKLFCSLNNIFKLAHLSV